MNSLPGLIFIVDSKKEKIAVAEAAKLNIPIVAIIDTNADPDLIDFPIAGNDDAIKSIRVITNELSEAIFAAKHGTTVAEMAGDDGGGQVPESEAVKITEATAEEGATSTTGEGTTEQQS